MPLLCIARHSKQLSSYHSTIEPHIHSQPKTHSCMKSINSWTCTFVLIFFFLFQCGFSAALMHSLIWEAARVSVQAITRPRRHATTCIPSHPPPRYLFLENLEFVRVSFFILSRELLLQFLPLNIDLRVSSWPHIDQQRRSLSFS